MKRRENTFDLHAPDFAHVHGTFTPEDRWRLYITLYSLMDVTEGIPLADIHRQSLKRSKRKAESRVEQAVEKRKGQLAETAQDGLPAKTTTEWRYQVLNSHEGLSMRISPTTYNIRWDDDGSDEWWQSRAALRNQARDAAAVLSQPAPDPAGDSDSKIAGDGEQGHQDDYKATAFEERFVMNNPWMAGLSRDQVDEANKEFRQWKGADSDVVMVED